MNPSIQKVIDKAKTDIAACNTLDTLDEIRVALLGKKGTLTAALAGLGSLSPEERRAQGQHLNLIKEDLQRFLEHRKQTLEEEALDQQLASEKLDVTLPAYASPAGKIHPISHTIQEVMSIFASMGFKVADGPDIEDDFHNFTALNVPADHPARQMQDTFYLAPTKEGQAPYMLRTHTSNVQIRNMVAQKGPTKVMSLGRVFRADYDQTHTPMFHQMEGIWIDTHVTFADLKGCLTHFLNVFFGMQNLPVRFRPSYFPFTEPSAEVDIGCKREGGRLEIGAGNDWLEILGSGMVHPNVLKNCGIDPEKYQGFAFGMGIERIAMLKHGIPDLRTFFESDVRWLDHYGFNPTLVPSLLTKEST